MTAELYRIAEALKDAEDLKEVRRSILASAAIQDDIATIQMLNQCAFEVRQGFEGLEREALQAYDQLSFDEKYEVAKLL